MIWSVVTNFKDKRKWKGKWQGNLGRLLTSYRNLWKHEKETKVPRKSFNSNLWGIKLTNKERLERDKGLKFGVVITLKEMFGRNRIQEFIDQCTMRNWIVNRINIENRLDIYASAEEIIKFE